MAISTIGQNGLQQSRILTTVQQPAGAVLQVVQATKSTEANTNSVTYVTTGLAASITPTSATSKILILAEGSYYSAGGNNYYTIYRGSTNLEITSGRGLAEMNITASTGGVMNMIFLDSPATTSSTTYTIYTKQSATVYFPVDGVTATITLMEIAV